MLNFAKSEPRTASAVTDLTLKVTSLLLDPNIAIQWQELDMGLQREMSSDLSSNLNDAAFFLASDISSITRVSSSTETSTSVNWTQANVQLAVKIEDHESSKASGSSVVTWDTGYGDSVMFTNADLIEAVHLSPREKLAVTCISYKNLGKYMQDNLVLGGMKYPVNSHLISVSVRKLDGSPVTMEKRLQLERPITLQFQHSKRNGRYSQNRCAFWNHRHSWSHEGCESQHSNVTHTTCKCKHLTTFSVLSTNESDIPGFPTTPGITVVQEPRFVYLAIVRGGLIISLTLLLFVAVSLTVYR